MYEHREGLPRFGLFQWCIKPKFKKIACQPFMPTTVPKSMASNEAVLVEKCYFESVQALAT